MSSIVSCRTSTGALSVAANRSRLQRKCPARNFPRPPFRSRGSIGCFYACLILTSKGMLPPMRKVRNLFPRRVLETGNPPPRAPTSFLSLYPVCPAASPCRSNTTAPMPEVPDLRPNLRWYTALPFWIFAGVTACRGFQGLSAQVRPFSGHRLYFPGARRRDQNFVVSMAMAYVCSRSAWKVGAPSGRKPPRARSR
jgi:hypothetical protein